MARPPAGGGVTLSPAALARFRYLLRSATHTIETASRELEQLAALQDPDAAQEQAERARSSSRFASHVRWHVRRKRPSDECEFCVKRP